MGSEVSNLANNLYFKSTRGYEEKVLSSEAIVRGLAPDGGLYVPEVFPVLEEPISKLLDFNYKELSFYILKNFFSDISEESLKNCIDKAYDRKFDTPIITPLVEKKGYFFLELYHGPTLSFKDIALSLLPYLLKASASKLGIDKEIVILTATSGDTGKAALEAFSNVEGTFIITFYPKGGVSKIQERQMLTQEGKNTFVIGVEGNFDDAQRGVKEIFSDREILKALGNRYIFSSANSINIGRLFPQIVYYFFSYLRLLESGVVREGESINVVVPTGNFGNILSCYYAKKMGLPIKTLICSSNENNVLYIFLKTGVYDIRRKLKVSLSPSMDILISSNLERLLYEICDYNADLVASLIKRLSTDGRYEISPELREKLRDFYGGFATDTDTLKAINEVYNNIGYLIDPHTAVGYYVYKNYVSETKDTTPTVLVSTASPFKFPSTVLRAIEVKESLTGKDAIEVSFSGELSGDEFSNLEKLAFITGLNIPESIRTLARKKVIHNVVCRKEEMKDLVLKILKDPYQFRSHACGLK